MKDSLHLCLATQEQCGKQQCTTPWHSPTQAHADAHAGMPTLSAHAPGTPKCHHTLASNPHHGRRPARACQGGATCHPPARYLRRPGTPHSKVDPGSRLRTPVMTKQLTVSPLSALRTAARMTVCSQHSFRATRHTQLSNRQFPATLPPLLQQYPVKVLACTHTDRAAPVPRPGDMFCTNLQ